MGYLRSPHFPGRQTRAAPMPDWRPYAGDAEPHAVALPPAPPWRRFDAEPAGVTFRPTAEMVEAVNAAMLLRRPLLLTGPPGSGKSSLVESVARELRLGTVLRWHVTSRSTLEDALYRYDAIARLQDHTLAKEKNEELSPIGKYLRLGPLGTALLSSNRPRALLIDEIDKGDIDLPNDLLNVFERGEFEIPELVRHATREVEVREHGSDRVATVIDGRVQCQEFPFVVLTSNGERDFPAAFLRRCIRLRMPDPTPELLTAIVRAHLGDKVAEEVDGLITDFAARAQRGRGHATDQLMNAVHIVMHLPDDEERARMVELLLKELSTDLR